MSRTFRRKNNKPHNHSGSSACERDYTTDRVDTWEGAKGSVSAWGGKPRVLLTGDEYCKEYHRYHADTKSSYGWAYNKYSRDYSHQQARNKNKVEIVKWFKNPEYEVINHEPRCLSWDD